ncbi:hypothetical protein BDW62DRAFT_118519 [Aspergillus aurantiobrunneus]
MNWTGGRLRRRSEIHAKSRRQTFGKSSASSKGRGPHQITLFNSLAGYGGAGERKGKLLNNITAGPDDRTTTTTTSTTTTTQPLPRPRSSSNTGTQVVSRPEDRLEKMKRQLLETTDWAAVGAARPVQMAFTPEEDLERFGKRRRLTRGDHERLNTSTTMPPRPREEVPLERGVPENLEIRIDGRRLGQQDAAVDENENGNENSHPNESSQSMLLDEESLGSNRRANTRDSAQRRNSALRKSSRLSILSDDARLDYLSDVSALLGLPFSDPRLPAPMHRDSSSSMDWVVEERTLEPQPSSESSSIIPQPESPVRRRFTIDDQAIADRQGRLIVSSPAEPQTTQRLHDDQLVRAGRSQAHMRFPLRFSSQLGSGFDLYDPQDNTARPTYSHYGWLPQACRGMEHPETNHFAVTPMQHHSVVSPWSRDEQGREPRMLIYGQPVVFQESNEHVDGHAREDSEPREMDIDTDHPYSRFSSGSLGLPSDRT